MEKVLIISDKRVGHENQSIAFCEILGFQYEILHVTYKNKLFKTLSYLYDFLNIYTNKIFTCKNDLEDFKFKYIILCGSATYYAGKYFAKKFGSKAIALMNPKGFRNDFFHIFVPFHDNVKHAKNTTILPTNVSHVSPKNIFNPAKKSIAIIIGGNNSSLIMQKEVIKKTLENIMVQFKDYEIAITTSPRTPKDIEEMIENMNFSYSVIYSKNKINPIADFLFKCEYVFITEDSTSMISDAVCNGSAKIEIIKINNKIKTSKFLRLINHLHAMKVLHVYDNKCSNMSKKIDLKVILKEAIK